MFGMFQNEQRESVLHSNFELKKSLCVCVFGFIHGKLNELNQWTTK